MSFDTVATKGAPESVAELCHLTDAQRTAVSVQSARLAACGLRVLGVAKAQHPKEQTWPETQHEFALQWLGLVGLADPLRPEVPQAIAQCRKAGIRVVMITGDHPRTAQAIAAQAGIPQNEVVTGDTLVNMTPQELTDKVAQASVFARIKPHQKLALVEALKAKGEVVAMTGDGVNDAPALKAAHIGVAMGQRGTDVAREAAALVLLEDDFTAIVKAIHRGRQTFANLRQAMVYTLAVHVPIIGLALMPVLLGLPLVLAPLHIAFLELVIDPACSIVFEAEEGAIDLMEQPPRRTTESLLSTTHVLLSLLQGMVITVTVVGLYAWLAGHPTHAAAASTAAFVVLVAANAVLILPSRNNQTRWRSLWQGLTPVSLWVLGGTLVALTSITTVPWLAHAFGFVPLSLPKWLATLGVGLLLVMPLLLCKRLVRPRNQQAFA